MRRDITEDLVMWKEKANRSPLLIRGARQVGKSYVVEDFAKNHFKNSVVVNFELTPEAKQCFTSLDPKDIINRIQLQFGVSIDTRETLVFLDEIQECPQAIKSLRYFKEKMPQCAVIGAGSLLEFALQKEKINVPVGRVQFLTLEPLSFNEFLWASNNEYLCHYLDEISLRTPIEEVADKRLRELFRLYLLVGGMPAVVKEFIESGDLRECQRIQNGLLETYRNDFGKYASLAHHKYLEKVFLAAPRLAGQRVKYVNIDSEIKSRDLKNALELLSFARIVRPVYASSASGIPLGSMVNERKFKLSFLDVGLMQNACGLETQILQTHDILQVNSGAIVEQFVGQELRSYADKYQHHVLYFWARDKKSSSAEVDYLMVVDGVIYPLEVKAGKRGTLRSLRQFLNEKQSPLGVRVSLEALSFHERILSVPLYMIRRLSELIRECKK